MEFPLKIKHRTITWSNNPGHVSGQSLIWKDTYNSMFIPEQFTRAKIWRQPTCPSTEEWVKKIWYTHTHTHTHTQWNITQLYKEWKNDICNNMEGPGDYHTKWNKSEKDKYYMISSTCRI